MNHRLNFIHLKALLFLAFVSFLDCHTAIAKTGNTTKAEIDDFANFEKELEQPKTSPENSEKKIESLKKDIRASTKNANLINDLAGEFYKKGEFKKATALLWKHVERVDRKGFLILARAHESLNEPGEMIRALNILIGKKETDPEAHTLMGNAHLLAKKNREALESYKRAIEINDKYEPAYSGLISLYEKREPPNLYELRIIYQDMIDHIGPRPEFTQKLCQINTQDGTYEAAITTCAEAIAQKPNHPDSYVYLAISQNAAGNEDVAVKTLKKAAADFPKSEFTQFQYAKHLEDQKNYLEAYKFFKVATENDGKSARAWLGLATTSFEIKKFEVSLISYGNACRFDKKNAVPFRKATAILRNQKNSQWLGKFEVASENCTF